MNIELSHRFAPDVDVLDLLRGDVLALCQLEDVLLPVNDLQRSVLQERRCTATDDRRELIRASAAEHWILDGGWCELYVRTGNHLPMSPV